MLRRKATEQFEAWKGEDSRKALLVTGARQVGKSYAIRDFAQRSYEVFIEINLYENSRAREALSNATDATDLITRISLLSNKPLVPGNTAVFIDEVQELPEIVTMAKFLVEDGRFDWIFSGSMLGTELKGIRSYPVGYVHDLTMHPIDFEEFCWAIGVSDAALESIASACETCEVLPDYLHDAIMANFRTYLTVGGMPEVVQRFLDTKGDLASVRELQSGLNRQYRVDISKYAGNRAMQVRSIFDQLPVQLEGESQKFVVSSIDPAARYERYQRDFVWLVNAGVANKTDLVGEPKAPLLRTAQPSKFKLYQSDTGMLLARYPQVVAQSVYLNDKRANLGGVYENVVAQGLAAQGYALHYYMTKKRGEVDFVVESQLGGAVPIEVKSGSSYHSHASLDYVLNNAEYGVELGVVFCKGNFERDGKVVYVPLYALPFLGRILGEKDDSFKLEVVRV